MERERLQDLNSPLMVVSVLVQYLIYTWGVDEELLFGRDQIHNHYSHIHNGSASTIMLHFINIFYASNYVLHKS